MKKAYAIVLYLVSLGYIFLGALIYDWTTHMAPAMDGRGNARNVFWDIFLVCLGLILFVTVFLKLRNKISGFFLPIIFYCGLMVILVGGFIASLADRSANNPLLNSYSQFLLEALVLYAPMIFLYFFRQKE
jgi:hypothetical membrane protein